MVDTELALQERIKELKCLFRLSELVDYFQDNLDSILQGLVEVLPASWQYPDITTVSIDMDERKYQSSTFKETSWMQKAPIRSNSVGIGTITVAYNKLREEQYEGPFLKEERLLLNAVAERVGRIIERVRAKEKLKIEEQDLKNKSIALRELMQQAERENKAIADRLQTNLDTIILPLLAKLEQAFADTSHAYSLNLLKHNLREITSPFYSELLREFNALSPKELRICNMISRGYSSKEIAQVEQIAASTVGRHRENIRKKLGLTNSKINLERHLQDFYMKEGTLTFKNGIVS